MSMAGADSASWTLETAGRAATLEVVMPQQRLVLAWSQFVYAEGAADEVRIAFATHDVVIKGAGLDQLMHAIASHRVVSIRESPRSGQFFSPAARFIREIAVRKIEVDG